MNLRLKVVLNVFLALCMLTLLGLLYFQENVSLKWRPMSFNTVACALTTGADAPVSLNSSIQVTSSTESQNHTYSCYLRGNPAISLLNYSSTVDVGIIFARAEVTPALRSKLQRFLHSLLKHTSVPVSFHLLSDTESVGIASDVLQMELERFEATAKICVYDIEKQIERSKDLIMYMQQHFTARPGTYYSDALFFLSLTLHEFLPDNIHRLILVDVDTEFTSDIKGLNDQFDQFADSNLMGMAPELSPVYRHILYSYRNKHKNTLLGEPRGKGFPGFNSGLILMDLDRLRRSFLYPELLKQDTVVNLTTKYNFKGHLGDQDFYTLVALEHPDLFHQLPCNWNRQLCQWWRNKGYEEVFDDYFQCAGPVYLYHGNCNTPISSLA